MKHFARLRQSFALAALIGSAYGQAVIVHRGEDIFVIVVHGSSGATFRGNYLAATAAGESNSRIEGVVPAEFTVVATHMFLTVQKLTNDGQIDVEIAKNGATVRRQGTDAPYGVVGLATAMPEGGAPQQAVFEVTGSAKFAFLTMAFGTGETRQEQVRLPFSKEFYPKVGWIVGLSAQKTRVTRLDPLSIQKRIEVLDDGVKGSVHVVIRVSGGVLGEADTAEPFGVASATVRLP